MSNVSRRTFIRNGVTAFTVSMAAPAFLSDIARAQGAASRNLVVLYLGGGNDALNTIVPYTDAFYYSRRPTIAVPVAQVLQIGTDSSGKALGLHPRLRGLQTMFNEGRLAIIQRTGYANSSRSHFQGQDIWGTANPGAAQGIGWLGRYLDAVAPTNPLAGWNTTGTTPRALVARTVGVPAIADARTYSFASPNTGSAAVDERNTATRMSSYQPSGRAQLAFVNSQARGALGTLDSVATVASYTGTVTYGNDGFSLAMRTVAGAIVRGIGTRIFWVQTGGYDTHAGQGATGGGAYANLMTTLNTGLFAFYQDLRNQGLLNNTLVVQFSEFGRRVTENGSGGTDHGSAASMMVAGGGVRGGIYGTAPSLNPSPQNATLENNGTDVHFETDFRSVYARVLDSWLGADSVAILGGNYKNGPAFI